MKTKILICVPMIEDPSADFLESLRHLKQNEKYNVIIHMYDYRIIKTEELKLDFAKVKSISFEKRPDSHTEIQSSLFATGATIFICLTTNAMLPPDFIDVCGIDKFDDENIGLVYSDFYVKLKNSVVGFVHKSMPVAANLLPVLIFRRDSFLKNFDQGRDSISATANTSLSVHIPKKLFTVKIDG